MSFDDRFELGELLRDDGIRLFGARQDRRPGPAGALLQQRGETPKLLASLERLPERERRRIVDRGERDGAPYVVTGTLAGHPGFREWLTANARDAKPLGAAGAWKVIPAQPSVDEQFLSLFPTSESPQLQPEAAPAPPPPSAPEAGAFTRMFQAPANLFPPQPPLPLPPQPPPQPAPARSDLVNREPAKSGPAPNNEPARNNEPAKNNEPGEFTRMFQALPPHTQPGQTSLPTAPPPASPKTEAAGEFTRFFEAQVHESHVRQADLPPVQAMPAASRQGEFTRVFGPGQTLGRSSDKPGQLRPAPVRARPGGTSCARSCPSGNPRLCAVPIRGTRVVLRFALRSALRHHAIPGRAGRWRVHAPFFRRAALRVWGSPPKRPRPPRAIYRECVSLRPRRGFALAPLPGNCRNCGAPGGRAIVRVIPRQVVSWFRPRVHVCLTIYEGWTGLSGPACIPRIIIR